MTTIHYNANTCSILLNWQRLFINYYFPGGSKDQEGQRRERFCLGPSQPQQQNVKNMRFEKSLEQLFCCQMGEKWEKQTFVAFAKSSRMLSEHTGAWKRQQLCSGELGQRGKAPSQPRPPGFPPSYAISGAVTCSL